MSDPQVTTSLANLNSANEGAGLTGTPITERIDPDCTPTTALSGTSVIPPQDARVIEIGTVLSRRYLVERAIGSGGMSTVFSALDRHRMHGPAADAKVAVKVLNRALLSDKARVQRLIREFRYMQRLTHRGIVRVFDLDCDEGTWFITMEMLQGQPLTQYLHRHQPEGLPPEDALRLLTECTEALVCAHEHGVIHGDLKPGNIFVDEKGTARLLDFGSVPEKDETADAPPDRFLTPAYASPQMMEQQPADLRDDLFSLGCVAYELFTGQHPFRSLSSIEAREEGLRLNWIPSIPARHFGVIARMLSWERDDRPANGREFLDSLMAAQVRAKAAFTREPKPVEAASSATHSRTARRQATNPTLARNDERRSQGERHVSRQVATPEELSRAFAKFAGVVPDDWTGGEERPAVAPVAAKVATGATAAPQTPTPTPAAEPAKERWSKAIPPEWLEPKPKLEESAVPSQRTSAAEESADDSDTASPEEAETTRAVPWLSQLRWNNARVLNRVRRGGRTPPAAAATAGIKPPIQLQAERPPEVEAKSPVPIVDPPPAAKRSPTLQLRSSTPVSWNALASRLRTLRVRAASRTVAPALEGTANTTVPTAKHLAHPGWIPQLQWRNEITTRWTDVQAPTAVAVIPHVHIGTLPLPVLTQALPMPAPSMPAAVAVTPTPRVDWHKAMARVSRVSAESRDQLRAQVARLKSTARSRKTQIAEPPNVAPAEGTQVGAAPSDVAAATPRQPLDWKKLTTNLTRVSAQSRDSVRAFAAKECQQWRKEFKLLPHWVELRRAIGSLATSRASHERQSLSQWLTQRAPQWREAVPATAIAGIAFIAWGLLQISAASRSDARPSGGSERLAALRLQELADAPIDITLPVMADLALPTIRMEQRPLPVRAAPGFISFQSARIHVSSGQRMAVVNLRRNESTDGSAPFGWHIAPGTARPGVDYEQPKIQIARFNDGQNVRSVYIPIKPAKAGGRPERRFTIQLTRTPGGPALGDITEAEVVIEGSG